MGKCIYRKAVKLRSNLPENINFVWLAAGVFLVEVLISVIFSAGLDFSLRAVLVLSALFLKSQFVEKPLWVMMPVLWFDIWSGAVFGAFMLSIFIILILIHFVKKSFLISDFGPMSFVWIFFFYCVLLVLFPAINYVLSRVVGTQFIDTAREVWSWALISRALNPASLASSFLGIIFIALILNFYVPKKISNF